MRQFACLIALAAALAVYAGPAGAQPVAAANGFTYADLADLVGRANVVADVQVRQATRLKDAAAGSIPPGKARFYIEADLLALIRGADGLPGQIHYLADVPLDSANHPPKLKKARFILFAALVAGRPGEVRLVGPDAQVGWSAAFDARARDLLRAIAAPDAPPQVTGIGNAFHVPGSVPGESETQIFLTTQDGRPVSLSILRRPQEPPRWAVALGEMVDEAAAPPARDTLLWYRLACFLPRALPDSATASLAADAAAATRADYDVVVAGLGECTRSVPSNEPAAP